MDKTEHRSLATPTETDTFRRPAGAGQAAAAATPAAVVEEFNKAWNDHDLSAALALISEDCVFESTAPAPDGERAVGKAAIRAAWAPIFADATPGSPSRSSSPPVLDWCSAGATTGAADTSAGST